MSAPSSENRTTSPRTREDVLREATEIADQAPSAKQELRDRLRLIFRAVAGSRQADAA